MEYQELKAIVKAKSSKDRLSQQGLIRLKSMYLESKRQEGAVCEKCGRTENITLDHIVPLEFLKNLGLDLEDQYAEENLRILCKTCNHFKGSRLDFSTPKTKELLLKYLEPL